MINVLRLLTIPVLVGAGALIEHYRPMGTRWQIENVHKLSNLVAAMDAQRCCHD